MTLVESLDTESFRLRGFLDVVWIAGSDHDGFAGMALAAYKGAAIETSITWSDAEAFILTPH